MDSSLALWHKRLGHVGEKGLKELVKRGIFTCSDQESVKLCESCLLGKGKKLPNGSGKHTSTRPLDYCHSDLWGPSSEKSTGGGRYFLSIIDDFSRKVWVRILKEKSEAFESFKIWHKAVEVEKGYGL